MRSLYLSTIVTVDVNAKLILKAATTLLQQPSSPSSSTTTPFDKARLDAFVHVHDSNRETFLFHAQHLYGAALTISPSLRLDVIPILNEVQLSRGSGESEEALFAKASAPLEDQGITGTDQIRLYTKDAMESEREQGFKPLYRFVAVGGTFDHLHSGHKLLLTTAALYASERLRCGVTGDALLAKKKFADKLQPIEVRMQTAESFLRRIRADLALDLEAISDVSGGTDSIADVEALTVSPETEKSLPIINELRNKNGGLKPMVGIPIPYVRTPSGHVISSTELRQGLEKAQS